MANTIAEHRCAFIPFDCSVYPLAVFVTLFSADVGCVDRWLLAGCELVILNLIVLIHTLSATLSPWNVPGEEDNMAFTRKMVTFNGILTGQILTSTSKCVVSAEEVTDDYTRTVRLARISIQSVAERLPDDTYELSFESMKQMLRYEGGFWNAI